MCEVITEKGIKTVNPEEMRGNYGMSTALLDSHDPHDEASMSNNKNEGMVFNQGIKIKVQLSKIDPNELDMIMYLSESDKTFLFENKKNELGVF